MGADARKIRDDFAAAVNMTATQIRKWLDTEESKSVGDKGGGGESTGHQSGRRIVAILDKKAADLTDADLAHMRKVTGYVHRHLKQRPNKPATELQETAWRYSLMNWGHDPLK